MSIDSTFQGLYIPQFYNQEIPCAKRSKTEFDSDDETISQKNAALDSFSDIDSFLAEITDSWPSLNPKAIDASMANNTNNITIQDSPSSQGFVFPNRKNWQEQEETDDVSMMLTADFNEDQTKSLFYAPPVFDVSKISSDPLISTFYQNDIFENKHTQALEQVSRFAKVKSGELNIDEYTSVEVLLMNDPEAYIILEDLFLICHQDQIHDLIYECKSALFSLIKEDQKRLFKYFPMVFKLPLELKLDFVWSQAFLSLSEKAPKKMLVFLHELMKENHSILFPGKESFVQNSLRTCGVEFVERYLPNFRRLDEYNTLCELLTFLYPSWDFPFPVLQFLIHMAPQKTHREKLSLTLEAYAKCLHLVKIEEFQELINILCSDKKYEAAQMLRGWCSLNLKKASDAISSFSQALGSDPNFTPALKGRAIGHFQNGQPELALKDLNQVFKIEPDDRHALMIRGNWYARNSMTTPAIEDFSLALEKDPNNIHVLLMRAKCYHETSVYDRAFNDYSTVFTLDPHNWDAKALWARCTFDDPYGTKEQKRKAIIAWREVLMHIPDHIFSLSMLAEAYAQSRQPPELDWAITYCEKILDLNQNAKKFSALKEKCLNKRDAIYAAASQIPQNENVNCWEAKKKRCFEQLDQNLDQSNYDAALSYAADLLEIEPDNKRVLEACARIYKRKMELLVVKRKFVNKTVPKPQIGSSIGNQKSEF